MRSAGIICPGGRIARRVLVEEILKYFVKLRRGLRGHRSWPFGREGRDATWQVRKEPSHKATYRMRSSHKSDGCVSGVTLIRSLD